MSLSDPIGDMIARIKNAQIRNHKKLELPSSNFKVKIADVLKNEGFIIDYKVNKKESNNLINNSVEINNKFYKVPKMLLDNNLNNDHFKDVKEALNFNKNLILENFILPNKLKFPLFRNILENYYS